MGSEKYFLGSDHAGFNAKEKIKKFLDKKKINYLDLTPKKIEGDDYPDQAFKVSKKVANSNNAKGILVCGSGTGMVIAANKVKGIRAVAPYDKYTAKMSKVDNDANVIALRGRGFPIDKSKEILNSWMKAEFSKISRHKRRINKINRFKNEK